MAQRLWGRPVYHLDDVDWRALLIPGALLSAIAPQLADVYDLSHLPGVGAALNMLHLTANDAADRTGSDADAVAVAADEWAAELDAICARGGLSQDEREVLKRCRDLAGDAVADDPFDAMFQAIKLRAAELYDVNWKACELDLQNCIRSPGPPGTPYAVAAKTRPGDVPIVDLLIQPRGLGPASWAAIPSLLVHEIVCHVPAHQDRVKNTSAFAEGFMDWAASSWFFPLWIVGLDSRLAPMAREHARSLWAALADPATPEGTARRRGWRAGERLSGHLQEEGELPRATADALVARLGIELNVTSRPLAEKDLLVQQLRVTTWDDEVGSCLQSWLKRESTPADLLRCICTESL